MAKVITTNTYFDETAHLKKIDDIFDTYMGDKLEDMVGLTIFSESSKTVRNSTYLVGQGLTGVKLINENADYGEAEGTPSASITMTKHKYGADVIVTEESKLYDEYNVIEDRIQSIVDDGMDNLDSCLADVFIKGFATTPYVDKMGLTVTPIGQEARALFNSTDGTVIQYDGNDHPTLSNLSVSAVRVQAAKHTDINGQARPIKLDVLLVGPALEDKAERIAKSEKLTSNNDINPNKGKFEVKVWDRLAQGDAGNSTDNYRFMYNKSKVKKQLKFEWARMPKLQAPTKIDANSNDRHKFSMIYSYGFLNLSYVFGSRGTYTVTDEPLPIVDMTSSS